MHRILLEEWRKKYFTLGAPSLKALITAFDHGDITGKKMGELRIVYCDDNYEPIAQLDTPHNTPKVQTGCITPIGNMHQLIDEYQTYIIDKSRNSARTLDEKRIKLNQYRKRWGEQLINQVSVRDITMLLNTLTDHAYIKHQMLLKHMFAFAIHQGYRTDNPVIVTMSKTEPRKIRLRHTLEGYQAIYAAAPDWLQRAMRIALHTLQRRADLVNIMKSDVDLAANTLRISQGKTENYSKPVHLLITMGDELRQAVQDCYNTGIDCPYLLHYQPIRITSFVRSKPHVNCITEDLLTKTFKSIRNKVGCYNHLPNNQRPTFHEIRALGIWLYEQQGFDDDYIRALSGHATQRMLAHYKAGHGDDGKTLTVEAGLSLRESSPIKRIAL